LQDLKQRLDHNPWIAGRPIDVQWRLTHGLDAELGIEIDYENLKRRPPLDEAIEMADAVITTPSTLFLEGVIKRRPTAILDYSNSPSYFDSAWRITAPLHIQPTLEELASPPPPKLQYQRSSLHDQLECATAAKPRLFALITNMVEHGAAARASKTQLALPSRILSDPQRGIQVVESEFDRSILYPDNNVFQDDNTLRLQTELCQAIARLDQLPGDLLRKERHIAQMEVYLDEALERVRAARSRESRALKMIEQQNQVLAKKTDHISNLDQHLQDSLNRVQQLKAKLEEQTETIEALANFVIATRLFAITTDAVMPPEQLQTVASDLPRTGVTDLNLSQGPESLTVNPQSKAA
jgi:signal transduction histidine kinase